MRYDFTPLFRSTVGFDHVGRVLEAVLSAQDAVPSYPPYNIERIDQNRYRITMAVAGFGEKDIEATQQDNMLTVKAHRPDEIAENVHFLHRGIASRGFERRFTLAEYVNVRSAAIENGLLTIDLERELPEEMKPRKVPINRVSGLKRLAKKAA